MRFPEFQELAKPLQIAAFSKQSFSQHFRKFAQVAARLLH
jgi:hypothetical protein